MDDPTITFLQSLQDESKWVIRRNVPIFKPHVRKNPLTGEVLYEVTESDIPTIAKNMNDLQTMGIPSRITPGHVLTKNNEESQPSLYGFGWNAKVGRFGPKNELAVLVDEYLYPETADKAGKLPFRSAEYYQEQKVIRGVAKLIRDPYLDLGVVTYEAHGACFSYEAENAMEPTPEEQKQLDAMMQKYKAFMCQKYNLVEKPGAGNPPMPGAGGGTAGEQLPEAIRLELGKIAQQYQADNATLLGAVGSLRVELKSVRDEKDAEKNRRLLENLVNVEHYSFDVEAEVKRMASLDEAGTKGHLDYIRKNFKKTDSPPTGSGGFIPINLEAGNGAGGDQATIEVQAMNYCREHPGSDFLKVLEDLDKARTAKK